MSGIAYVYTGPSISCFILSAASWSVFHHWDICRRTTVLAQEESLLPIATPGTTATPMTSLAPKDGPFMLLTWAEANAHFGQTTWLSWARQRGLAASGGGVRSNVWLSTHLRTQSPTPPSCSGPRLSPKLVSVAGRTN